MIRILVAISSLRRASVKLRTAAFVAQYIDPPGYDSLPAMLPILMISPLPPSSLLLNIGSMAWVMLIRPVTLVENMTLMSWTSISGAFAMPLTKPLQHAYQFWRTQRA